MVSNMKGYLCVFAGFLIHLSLGSIYTFGNISPYIASYMKIMTKSYTVKNADMVWIFAFAIATQGLSMSIGGFLEIKIGSRFTTLIGCFIMSLSVMLTYLTIQVNLYATILTYGATFGFGVGIAYSVVLATTIKWFPKNRGLVIGIVVAGFGLGSLIFNQIQTIYINPKNISPNSTNADSDKYFTNNEVLERVPKCFILTGIIYASIQICGCLLLFTPVRSEITMNIDSKEINESTNCSENIHSKADDTKEDENWLLSIDRNNLSLKRILRQRDFWILWFIFVFLGTTNVFITSLYKTFGQLFITNDYYLAIVGSVASIFNASGRIFWGKIMDRFSYKQIQRYFQRCFFHSNVNFNPRNKIFWLNRQILFLADSAQYSVTIAIRCLIMNSLILFGTFYLCFLIKSSSGAKVMYMIWVCGIFANICGIFAIMPVATSKLFGLNKVAILYGILFSANAVGGILGASTTSALLSIINYLGIFEIGAGMLFITLILTFFHKPLNF